MKLAGALYSRTSLPLSVMYVCVRPSEERYHGLMVPTAAMGTCAGTPVFCIESAQLYMVALNAGSFLMRSISDFGNVTMRAPLSPHTPSLLRLHGTRTQ